MGKPRWRLQTALNYLARNVEALGLEGRVDVIVSDWASEVPLRKEAELGSAARRMVRFLEVSPELAASVQKDSPFPEVLALNAVVRRASGDYIGRIDQDTLVGRAFLKRFFDFVDGNTPFGVNPEACFLFALRRMMPYEFAVRCGAFTDVVTFLNCFKGQLPVEEFNYNPWFNAPTGIMVLHRDLWAECGGYDERFIYWGWMETDLGYRLEEKYPLVNLSGITGVDFYHLEHVKPSLTARTARKKNYDIFGDKSASFHPNGPDWGLAKHDLPLLPGEKEVAVEKEKRRLSFAFMLKTVVTCVVREHVKRLYLSPAPAWLLPLLNATRGLRERFGLRASQIQTHRD
ncbi:MAG: hypothetical protein Q8R76_08835 [Candidatus Omnitrophota bacterium]|nr:hypothetical protein [Candidatus Omnitrophota bacterium]